MILKSSSILEAGESYTFTYDSGAMFNTTSDDTILQGLRKSLGSWGSIVSASRGFFSNRYVVTVVPAYPTNLADWQDGFISAWADLDLNSAVFVQAEGGEKSTQAGGVHQVVQETAASVADTIGGTAATTITSALKPLAPYLIAVAAVMLLYQYMKHGQGK